MPTSLERIDYTKLNSRQQEIYNFQKAAASLADYGFNCLKLDDDWNGADFLADHMSGTRTLRVQLKGRLTIGTLYEGKNLHMMFPLAGRWVLIEHDELVRIVEANAKWAWRTGPVYHSGKPNARLAAALQPYMLDGAAPLSLAD